MQVAADEHKSFIALESALMSFCGRAPSVRLNELHRIACEQFGCPATMEEAVRLLQAMRHVKVEVADKIEASRVFAGAYWQPSGVAPSVNR
ncbi:MAG: hypothetical protein WD851_07160 [Pirellulales bacterium]